MFSDPCGVIVKGGGAGQSCRLTRNPLLAVQRKLHSRFAEPGKLKVHYSLTRNEAWREVVRNVYL